MRFVLSGILLLTLCVTPALVHAGLAICGNSVDGANVYNQNPALNDGLQRWRQGVDVSQLVPGCCMVAVEDTMAQVALMEVPGFDKRLYLVQATPACLAVSKSAGVIDTITNTDTALAQAATTEAAKLNTAKQNDFCKSNTYDALVAVIQQTKANNDAAIETARAATQAQIDGAAMTNFGQVKTGMKQLADKVYDNDKVLNGKIYTELEKMAGCMYAKEPVRDPLP